MTRHLVQYSGGIGSWYAARRVIQENGPAGVVLLFADTLVEDPDLYRFLDDAAAAFGVPLVRVADGRTPFQVFEDVSYIGNSRLAPCSHHLKQKPCRKWMDANCDPADTIVYVGIDWSEERRCPGVVRNWAPWRVEFPMTAEPHLSKEEMLEQCRADGIRPPRLYDLGYSHNNCGGVCVRAGQAQWRHLLATHPDRFADAERREAALRARLGDRAILTRQRGGVKRPLPLSQLRTEHEGAGHAPRASRGK